MTDTAFSSTRANGAGRGLVIDRVYTTPGVHPFDQVEWEYRDIVQTNWKSGEVIFEQRGVEFPAFWSINASTIVATKYFRGALGSHEREYSLRQLISRVVSTYTQAGFENGYFATQEDATIFDHELTYMLLNQIFSFNSPVWFNVGTSSPQQVSACFILSVDDTMESILNWYSEEGMIFKGGSGSGLNLSRIRSSKELIGKSGGTASGPVSFMRGADASAGTIKSGGATRRAAKMVVLDVDHPDIEEFIDSKAEEEKKIRALRDAGFDMELGGKDIASVQFQNANNSVRVTGEFMEAVERGTKFGLRARTTGEVIEEVDARQLFDRIAQAAWECADPGIQYDDTINDWHTTPESGRITASNPCSEYMHLDNSSCNLASLNLLKFLRADGTFDTQTFTRAAELIITAMDISICFADFPTEAIGNTTRAFRQLGIGYANLGALLMALGVPYDSKEGMNLAAAITSLMSAATYRRSAELAGLIGVYEGYPKNMAGHARVMAKHEAANGELIPISGTDAAIIAEATNQWALNTEIGARNGWRNSQISLLAPTGTIGFMMDCDTTGIEPDFSLVKYKKLSTGGSMQIVNQTIPFALHRLGYTPEVVEAIVEHISQHGHVVNAPGLRQEHYPIFDTAVGVRAIEPMGHVRMMAAVQPFLSGAISKTVNMPETATKQEVAQVYFQGWKLGLKALAIYRDNCKVGQPLSDAKAKPAATETAGTDAVEQTAADGKTAVKAETGQLKALAPSTGGIPLNLIAAANHPVRKRLPKSRPSSTVSFTVGGAEGYLTAGSYPDGGLGEVFIKLGKQGSTLAGVMDAFSIAVSIGLQYGVPLETFVQKFTNVSFEPAGLTDDKEIRMAKSLMDYIFRRLALDNLDFETRSALGILTTAERSAALDAGSYGGPAEAAPVPDDRMEVTFGEVTASADGEEAPEVQSVAPAAVSAPAAVTPILNQDTTSTFLAPAPYDFEAAIAAELGLQAAAAAAANAGTPVAADQATPVFLDADNEPYPQAPPAPATGRRAAEPSIDTLELEAQAEDAVARDAAAKLAAQQAAAAQQHLANMASVEILGVNSALVQNASNGDYVNDEEYAFAPAETARTARSSAELFELLQGKESDAPLCFNCGIKMRPSGSCHVCEGCGSTSGCS